MAERLPTFSERRRPASGASRIDRVIVEVRGWQVEGTRGGIDQFRNFLSAPPEVFRSESLTGHGWIFTRPNHRGGTRRPLQVRSKPFTAGGQIYGKPLFWGTLGFSRYFSTNADAERTSRLTFLLDLNLTRWLRYQPLPLDDGSGESLTAGGEVLRVDSHAEEAHPYDGEFAFDGEDNWLPDSDEVRRWTRPDQPFGRTQRYFDAVIDALESEMERAAQVAEVSVEREEMVLNLKSAECYWEYRASDPTGLVAELETPLRGYATRRFQKRVRSVADHGTIDEVHHNSRGIRVENRKGELIRVYAKTNRRVRVEVCYDFEGQGRFQPFKAHTREDWQLELLMNTVRTHSVKAARELFRGIAAVRKVPGSQGTVLSLLNAIVAACETPDQAEAVISLLVHNGSIQSRGAGPLLGVLGKLRDAKTFVWQGGSNHVHPRFRLALEGLQRNASGFPTAGGRGFRR